MTFFSLCTTSLLTLLLSGTCGHSTASPTPTDELRGTIDEDARQNSARLEIALLKQPRPGTLFNRVLDWHTDHDTLTDYIHRLQQTATPENSAAQLLLGLVLLHQERPAEALPLLQAAATARPTDPVAAWQLGNLLLQSGQPVAAARSLQLALTLKPASTDLPALCRDCAAAVRQATTPQQAAEFWIALPSQFPRNKKLAEMAAQQLQTAGVPDAALTIWQDLSNSEQNPETRARCSLQIARLQVQLQRPELALQTLQSELQNLAPESWLARQFLAEIDDLPQHTHLPVQLILWYQQQSRQSPDDLLLLEKLVQLLLQNRQHAAALTEIQAASARFPASTRLLRMEIAATTAAADYPAAEQAWHTLTGHSQTTAQDLEAFAAFMLQRPDLPQETRRQQATKLWLQATQTPPVSAAQLLRTARQLQQIDQFPAAQTLLLQAAQLQPENPTVHEALGQLLLQQNRRDQALLAFQEMAAGPRHNLANLQELTQVALSHGFTDAAVAAAAAAAKLNPDPATLIRLSRLLRESSTADPDTTVATQCLALLQQAESTAESLAESARICTEKALVLQSVGQLSSHLSLLTSQPPPDTADNAAATWLEIAILQRTAQNSSAALNSVRNAIRLQPNTPVLLQTAAAICQELGLLAESLQLHEAWLAAAPGQRSVCLPQIAQLHLQLGNRQAAAAAMLQLDSAADISPELAVAAADTLTAAGQRSAAIRLLRRILRQHPADSDLQLTLAELLWNDGQRSAALAACWQAFDSCTQTTRLKTLAASLVSLHATAGRTAELLDNLRTRSSRTDMDATTLRQTLLLAEAAGATDIARTCRLALLDAADTTFDDQLAAATHAVTVADIQQATELLRKLDSQPRSPDEIARIAVCAAEIPPQLLTDWIPTPETAQQLLLERLRVLDQRLQQKNWQLALDLASTLHRSLPPDSPLAWPLLLRLAICQWQLSQRPAALLTLQQLILEKHLPDQPDSQPSTPLPAKPSLHNTAFWTATFENSSRIFLDNAQSADLSGTDRLDSVASLRQAELIALSGLLLSQNLTSDPDSLETQLQQQAGSSASAARRLWAFRRLKSVRDNMPLAFRADSFQLLRLHDSAGPAAVIAELLNSTASRDKSPPLQLLQDASQTLTVAQSQDALTAITMLSDSLPPQQVVAAIVAIAAHSQHPLPAAAADSAANPLKQALLIRCNSLLASRSGSEPATFADLLNSLTALATSPRHTELAACLLASDISTQTQLSAAQLQAALDFWLQHGSLQLTDPHPVPTPATAPPANNTARKTRSRLQPDDLQYFLPAGDRQLLTAILAAADKLSDPLHIPATAAAGGPVLPGPAVRRCLLQLLLPDQSPPAATTDTLQQLQALLPQAWQPLWLSAELLERSGQNDQALAALQALSLTDATARRRRALSMLRLAALLQQAAPAEQAWQELAGMQLTVDERRECARQLRLAGMADQYQSLVQRTAPELNEASLQRLQDELTMYQQQGRLPEARELAERILQRPTGGGMKFRRQGRFTADDLRRSAESFLQQANSAVSPPAATP